MIATASHINLKNIYDQDFNQWLEITANLLKQKSFNELDLENLIEEIEAMGKSQKRELENRLIVLIIHLLKWKYQTNKRSQSWLSTILEQRRQLKKLLKDNPSLKLHLEKIKEECYEDAREDASIETRLNLNIFPEVNPFSLEEIFQVDFLP
jgi:hypothetical protein